MAIWQGKVHDRYIKGNISVVYTWRYNMLIWIIQYWDVYYLLGLRTQDRTAGLQLTIDCHISQIITLSGNLEICKIAYKHCHGNKNAVDKLGMLVYPSARIYIGVVKKGVNQQWLRWYVFYVTQNCCHWVRIYLYLWF